MLSLLLDKNWDITLNENGSLKTADKNYSIAQTVANAVKLFINDAYFNTDIGIPHFDVTLKRNPALSVIRSHIKKAAVSVDGVKNAAVIINNDNGIIQGEITITLENGETAVIGTGIIGDVNYGSNI